MKTTVTKTDIHKLLSKLGFRRHLKGYVYITQLVLMMLTGDVKEGYLCKFGYTKVARKCGSTDVNVERAVRHSISSAYDRNPMLFITEFGFYERPSNLELLTSVAEYFKDMTDGLLAM